MLEVRSGVNFFCVFHPFLNSPQNSEYFEYRHMGKKRITPSGGQKYNKVWSLRRQHFPPKSQMKKNWRKTGSKTSGVLERGGGGLELEQAAPLGSNHINSPDQTT